MGYEPPPGHKAERRGVCLGQSVAGIWFESLGKLSLASAMVSKDIIATASYMEAQKKLLATMKMELLDQGEEG